MKKIFLIAATLCGMVSSAFAAGTEAGDDNGFGLRLNVGIPMKGYGTTPELAKLMDERFYGVSFGGSMDNRWYVWDNKKMGVAIDARWVGVDIASKKDKDASGEEYKFRATTVELFAPGAIYSYYLNDNMAVDVQYNFAPMLMVNNQKVGDNEQSYGGMGVGHIVSAAYRWKFLQAGAEFRIGKPKCIWGDDAVMNFLDGEKVLAHNLKFFIGFKF